MIRLGGPIFYEGNDPEEFAWFHKERGYSAALCPEWAQAGNTLENQRICEVMRQNDIVIAEVGAWCNPFNPDPTLEKQARDYMKERLYLADELDARTCVNVLGSLGGGICGSHPDNFTQAFFDACVDMAREVIDAVKPVRAKLSFEIMPFTFLDGAEGYIKFLKAVDRKEAAVHLDPANCISNPRNYYNNATYLEDVIATLGPLTVSYHLKDLKMRDEGATLPMFEEVLIGKGNINYVHLLRAIDATPGEHLCIMEHLLSDRYYRKNAAMIRIVAESIGVEIYH